MKIPGLGALRYHLLTRPFDRWEARAAQRRAPALIAAATRLPPVPAPAAPDDTAAPRVYFLSGHRILHFTLFSAYSLLRTSATPLSLHVVSDGTLNGQDHDLLHRIFPERVTVESDAEQTERINTLFPADRFPVLRRGRGNSNLYRKLMDVHGGRTGWRLFVDSDTFFWRPPVRIEQGLRHGGRPVYSPDNYTNYGQPLPVISGILGRPVFPTVNSGLTGMLSERLDWERMEHWLAAIMERGGKPDFWEQALTAMHLTLEDAERLPAQDYVLSPSVAEVRRPTAVFHHYAGAAKNRFVRMNVPRVLLPPTFSHASP